MDSSAAKSGIVTIVCDHAACGSMYRKGMTEGQLEAAARRNFRNLPPCPRCGRRFNFRLASGSEIESAGLVAP